MPHSRFGLGTNVAVFTLIRWVQSVDATLPTFDACCKLLFIPIEDLITCDRVFLKFGTGRARMLALQTVSSSINRRTLPRTSLSTRGSDPSLVPDSFGGCMELVQSTWLGRHGCQRQCKDMLSILIEPVEAVWRI
jgi:hypothetical protein